MGLGRKMDGEVRMVMKFKKKIIGTIRNQKKQFYRFTITASSIKEEIYFPAKIKNKMRLVSAFCKDGRFKVNLFPMHDFESYVQFDEEGNLFFEAEMKQEKRENYENVAKQKSVEQKVLFYTFRCHECGRLYVLPEMFPEFGAKNGDVDFIPICRFCHLKKGNTVVWGKYLLDAKSGFI